MSGVAGITTQDIASCIGNDIPGCECKCGVEISLQRNASGNASASDIKRHAPVDSDNVGASLGHEAEQFTGPNTEMNPGNVEVGNL
ncbi:unannotated protein [freshwater metagenome]|uniref:Unannotated protein n=1 Tax=freshwater metagenome TaxID=449393 RepID=A0A6J6HCV3_9ZZZZ